MCIRLSIRYLQPVLSQISNQAQLQQGRTELRFQSWPLIACIVMLCIHNHIMMRAPTIYTSKRVCTSVYVYPIQCHLYAHNNFWYISLDIRLSSCMENTFRSIFHVQLGDVRNGGEVGERGEYKRSTRGAQGVQWLSMLSKSQDLSRQRFVKSPSILLWRSCCCWRCSVGNILFVRLSTSTAKR